MRVKHLDVVVGLQLKIKRKTYIKLEIIRKV